MPLSMGTDLLDLKYRADLEALESGDSERAVKLFAEALREPAFDPEELERERRDARAPAVNRARRQRGLVGELLALR